MDEMREKFLEGYLDIDVVGIYADWREEQGEDVDGLREMMGHLDGFYTEDSVQVYKDLGLSIQKYASPVDPISKALLFMYTEGIGPEKCTIKGSDGVYREFYVWWRIWDVSPPSSMSHSYLDGGLFDRLSNLEAKGKRHAGYKTKIEAVKDLGEALHLYRKEEWGEGKWLEEPDYMEWTNKETGYPCVVCRNGRGIFCGYVGIPKGHRGYEKEFEDHKLTEDITFHGLLPGLLNRKESYWYFGFDCGHAFDYAPADRRLDSLDRPADLPAELLGFPVRYPEVVYRDFESVVERTNVLALELFNRR